MSGRCPVTGCAAEVPEHRVMCAAHWRLVSDSQQYAVWSPWRAAKRARTLSAAARATAWKYYRAERQAAIEAACRSVVAVDATA